MPDHSGPVRRAVIGSLKADPGVSGLVGPRVHAEPPATPFWPFIYYGPPVSRPYATSCGDGSEHTITLHAFARGPAPAAIEALAAAVVAALDGVDLDVSLTHYGIDWIDSQIMPDGDETSAYHAVIRFNATVL